MILVLSYLMWKYPNISLEDHLAEIIRKRDKAKPNVGFLEQLRQFKNNDKIISI